MVIPRGSQAVGDQLKPVEIDERGRYRQRQRHRAHADLSPYVTVYEGKSVKLLDVS